MIRKILTACAALVLLSNVASAQLYGWQDVTVPANPTGTTDLTGKMMGLGAATNACQIRPQKTGVVQFVVSFKASNGTASDGFAGQLAYGTGTAPANAAAPSGTTLGSFYGSDTTATVQESVTLIFTARGLTLNTLYWYDVILKAVTGGTATMTTVNCQATELAN